MLDRTTDDATSEAYASFNEAYDFFNLHLVSDPHSSALRTTRTQLTDTLARYKGACSNRSCLVACSRCSARKTPRAIFTSHASANVAVMMSSMRSH
jgi:hypothetical protein